MNKPLGIDPRISEATLREAESYVGSRLKDFHPQGALVLGSGWGEIAAECELITSIPYQEIPGFGRASVHGHAGVLSAVTLGGVPLILFQGRRHWYEGEGWTPVAIPVWLSKTLGVQQLFLTSAVGTLSSADSLGQFVVVTDHINWMGSNPLLGAPEALFGRTFPELSKLYSPSARARLIEVARREKLLYREGVVAVTSGPSYETPAEIRMFRAAGADVVGMSMVPEALLATALGIEVVGMSCITNFATGVSPEAHSHESVLGVARSSSKSMRTLLKAYWKDYLSTQARAA